MLNLTLHDTILHWVPLNAQDKQPIFSDKTDPQVTDKFWLKKISDSVSKHYTRKVEEIGNQPGTVTQHIRLLMHCNTQQFIDTSKTVATLLHNVQKGNVSDGFLIILRGDIDNDKYVCLLKLESMEGGEATFNKTRNSYEIKNLEQILLTNKSKVFKMAFFVSRKGSLRDIQVMDDQVNREQISEFWLVKFLACRHIQTAEKLTKDFFDFICSYANSPRLKGDEPQKMKISLVAEMNSQSKTLSLAKFSKKYVPPELLSEFNRKAEQSGIPLRDFEKKISPSLEKQLSVRRFVLEHGIEIKIPVAALEHPSVVKMETNAKDETLITVKSRVVRDVT